MSDQNAELHRCEDLATLRETIRRALAAPSRAGDWNIMVSDVALRLSRQTHGLVLSSRLEPVPALDPPGRWKVCQLALPNLAHFPAIVALDGDPGSLNFLHRLQEASVTAVVHAIEQMLNQIEVWRGLLSDGATQGGRQ